MEASEIERELEELETRIERLRALYEQHFMGLEKLEPLVPRKDVDRRIWVLRREQIRNTGLRFKFQMLVQRYNTFQQYWGRTLREIESGTYRRDVLRAAKRFGAAEALTVLGRRRAKKYADLAVAQQQRQESAGRPAQVEELPDEYLEEEGEPIEDEYLREDDLEEAHELAADHLDDDDDDDRPTRIAQGLRDSWTDPPAASPPAPTAAPIAEVAAPIAPEVAAPIASASAAPAIPAPTAASLQPAPFRVPPPPARPSQPNAPQASPLRLGAPQPNAPRQSQPSALAPNNEKPIPVIPAPRASDPDAARRRVAELAARGKAPRDEAPKAGSAASPLELDIDFDGPRTAARAAGRRASSTKLNAIKHPAAASPSTGKPTSSASGGRRAPSRTMRIPAAIIEPPAPEAAPTPSAAAAIEPSRAAPPDPAPSAASAPAASASSPEQRPRPAAPRERLAPRDRGLEEARLREIYAKYIETKRAANESTAGITYEKLADSLRAQAVKLRETHPVRSIDYDVVVKNGKTLIKPILK